ncbi:MAG: phosphoribosylformylglycinamidine synthase subunit PurQ [Verrucomicrobia bacterium]|nr:phosphoribosylformylglycinamidine synthase subunit PurQ [Verrucomicrobiota bacterium]
MARPKALLFKFPGTNADGETDRALRMAGFLTEVKPIAVVDPSTLGDYRLLVFSGGFSYGDYVMAGRLAQLEIERRLGSAIRDFHGAGGHLLGICNGFQILSKIGILPPASLISNVSGRFVCRWVPLHRVARNNPFLATLPDDFELPVAHAEGRLVTPEPEDAAEYVRTGLAALTYGDNFNGSTASIAGLQDASGRALGLMPHPERFIDRHQHYDRDWAAAGHGWGHYLFQSIHDRLAASA